MRAALLSCAAAAAFLIAGQASAETVAIVNAHIFTSGPQGEIPSGAVVLKDGRIAAVGANVQAPAGARVIDARGGVVTAGLIAADSGLGAVEVGALGDDLTSKTGDLSAAFDVQYGLDPDVTTIPVARLGGVTGAIVTPNPAGGGFGGDRDEMRDDTSGVERSAGSVGLFAGQAAVIHLDAAAKNQLVKAKVAQIVPLGGAGAHIAGGARGVEFVKLKAILDDVRWYAKNRGAYDRAQARDLRLSREDLEALIPVAEGRQPLVLSVDRASDIRQALAFARDEHLKVVLDGAAEGWRVADEIAAAHVPVIVYPLQDLPGDFESLGSTLENAGRLSNAGVTVIIKAAEGGAHRVRETRYDAGNAVAHGMKWQAALDAITINPARAFGVGDQLGSIEPGKMADVVVWSGDPFEPASQPLAVFIDGHQQPMTSRQLELQKRYQDLSPGYPPQYR
ncbi:MAG: amidohydrolase family protein [Proteobacteria bacterium]|nr:amidohydrolase family protein [Pseudomonadota bacterium]